MKKIILIVILIILVIIGCLIYQNKTESEVGNTVSLQNTIINTNYDTTPREFNNESVENITENTNIMNEEINTMNNEEIKINLIVNNKTFTATLENNQTVQELIQNFPMTLNMSDLHSNEKYNYLNSSLTTNSSIPRMMNAGDIKLYGNNCLVVFYDDFRNSYSYTNLGKVDNVDEFVAELGNGSVSITFELAE